MELNLNTVAGPPSWKPLPVLFTTPFSLLGGAAPALWLAAARAGGALALLFAFRLGSRFAGRAAGGAVAAAVLLLSTDWLRELAHGYSEGLVAALLLWAVESHLDDRRGRALVLGFLVSLGRPEAWPFLALYAFRLWPRETRLRPAGAVLVLASPLLWIVPDWLGSGDPFHASAVARVNLREAGPHPGLHLLGEVLKLLPSPAWALAAGGLLLAIRRGQRVPAALGAAAVVSLAGLAAATEAGYPGSARFFDLAAPLAAVLAGAGAVWIVREAGPRRARAAALALLAIAAVPVGLRVHGLATQARGSSVRAAFQDDLRRAVQRAGGRAAVLGCGRPYVPQELWWNAGALAWDLRVPLERLGKVPEAELGRLGGVKVPAVVFAPLGATPPDDPKWVPTTRVARAGVGVRLLARAGHWSALAVARNGGGMCREQPRVLDRSNASRLGFPVSLTFFSRPRPTGAGPR